MTSTAATLEIDLGAIVANWRAMAARAPGAACAGVVKADAYGTGAVRVAPALAKAGCRDFFVAHLGEALEIHPALPADTNIYVLNGIAADECDLFAAKGLIPVINDRGQIGLWRGAAAKAGRPLPAVLHVDTGMSRLGLTVAEALALPADAFAGLDLRLVMSHLARAEEDVPLNAAQLERFRKIRDRWPKIRASFANSSGVFLGADYRFDMVRPGCAAYGINPTPSQANPVAGVATLSVPVLQVREIDRPESVGYGATHHVSGPTRIATIACGYADGWLRTFSNRGRAFIANRFVPIVGRVSMDLITLDVTGADVSVGMRAELLGPHLPVDEVATVAGTIGYEIMTRLGRRFARVYRDPA